MEVVAVNSAIYGLVLSMIICIISVAIFTGHLLLLLIIVIAILVMICCVVGIFYLAGWEMGAVEAVSLSILVGSSVDYCVHLVEGYILAGKKMSLAMDKPASSIRRERTSYAVRHIGVAIVCSALTTIIAAVPLTQTFIQPFAKFGSILLINTTVSLVITLTLTVALLATIAPARYKGTWKSYVKAMVLVLVLTGAFFLALYIATVAGVTIPGPSGQPLFS
uniref:SSD domain-containing protein n=1 Tax=Biomphalaria glabrata TaxID=6526 RepID=A0A2C9KWT5_BIOGL